MCLNKACGRHESHAGLLPHNFFQYYVNYYLRADDNGGNHDHGDDHDDDEDDDGGDDPEEEGNDVSSQLPEARPTRRNIFLHDNTLNVIVRNRVT